jgi:hypothetical protein
MVCVSLLTESNLSQIAGQSFEVRPLEATNQDAHVKIRRCQALY